MLSKASFSSPVKYSESQRDHHCSHISDLCDADYGTKPCIFLMESGSLCWTVLLLEISSLKGSKWQRDCSDPRCDIPVNQDDSQKFESEFQPELYYQHPATSYHSAFCFQILEGFKTSRQFLISQFQNQFLVSSFITPTLSILPHIGLCAFFLFKLYFLSYLLQMVRSVANKHLSVFFNSSYFCYCCSHMMSFINYPLLLFF